MLGKLATSRTEVCQGKDVMMEDFWRIGLSKTAPVLIVIEL